MPCHVRSPIPLVLAGPDTADQAGHAPGVLQSTAFERRPFMHPMAIVFVDDAWEYSILHGTAQPEPATHASHASRPFALERLASLAMSITLAGLLVRSAAEGPRTSDRSP
jgi:hypothetical protein